MDRYKKIFEAKQVGNLYHFTNIESLFSIIETDRLGVTKEEAKVIQQGINMAYGDTPPGQIGKTNFNLVPVSDKVSFTRNQSHMFDRGVRITIDGDKLSNNYKIEPIGSYAYGSKEAEERVPKIIQPISRYIKEIRISKKIWDDKTSYIWYEPYQDRHGNLDFEKEGKDYKKILLDYFRRYNIKLVIQ